MLSRKAMMMLLLAALVLKGALFIYAEANAPEAKMQLDSAVYLEAGRTLVEQGAFATVDSHGNITHEYYRTPGYPLFLGVLNGTLKLPLAGIIVIQILLTLLAAWIIYEAAGLIDPKYGAVAFIIMCFDPAVTVYSLMVLTETLYLFLLCCFIYAAISYFQKRGLKTLAATVLLLAAATYVRPVSFYLGIPLGLLILFAHGRKGWAHAVLLIVAVYALLFAWQARNHSHFREYKFCNIANATVKGTGLYKSYERNTDPHSQGLSPSMYYINVTARSLMSLMTRPVSFKYFGSDALKRAGKAVSYPWIVFWMIGLVAGLGNRKKGAVFWLLCVALCYFAAVTVLGTMWGTGARFRVPLMPFIAILSAQGWGLIRDNVIRWSGISGQ